MVNGQNSTQQRLYAIRVSVGIQAFCPALASEFMDRVVPSHPLQHIASVVRVKCNILILFLKVFSPKKGGFLIE